MYLEDVFTGAQVMAGIPALSVPCGLSGEGLPIGLQIMGPQWGEATILSAAYALEQALGLKKKPTL
jgi:aspartyl-tRNA(Asn)/glutamyl-tRNA(Gln) amidotransferase subunit A